jgi:hypothetical protein
MTIERFTPSIGATFQQARRLSLGGSRHRHGIDVAFSIGDAFLAMLNELAAELGAALGRERIYVACADRTWILDAGEDRG